MSLHLILRRYPLRMPLAAMLLSQNLAHSRHGLLLASAALACPNPLVRGRPAHAVNILKR